MSTPAKMTLKDQLVKAGFDQRSELPKLYNHNLFLIELALKIQVQASPVGTPIKVDEVLKLAKRLIRLCALIEEDTL